MIKKINMKQFIYFFVFFLALTLALFYVLESAGERAVQESLINSSKDQVSYAESILNSVINEASTYGIQYTADNAVRYYQSKKKASDLYDAQMLKIDILNRLSDPLLSSQAVQSISIYWRSDGDFITTGNERHFLKA